jgi:hypothetical protein
MVCVSGACGVLFAVGAIKATSIAQKRKEERKLRQKKGDAKALRKENSNQF